MTDRQKYSIQVMRDWKFTPEMRDLLHRRTRPFLGWAGVSTRPISMLLQEAYLQGMNDAIDALQHQQEATRHD